MYSADKIKLNIGVPQDMHDKLIAIADEKAISLASLVRMIIAEYLKKYKN